MKAAWVDFISSFILKLFLPQIFLNLNLCNISYELICVNWFCTLHVRDRAACLSVTQIAQNSELALHHKYHACLSLVAMSRRTKEIKSPNCQEICQHVYPVV